MLDDFFGPGGPRGVLSVAELAEIPTPENLKTVFQQKMEIFSSP